MVDDEEAISGRVGSALKSREQVEEELRRPIRRMPELIAESVFDDPTFQAKMNNWMIGTHILWGLTLAIMFVGLNYGMIWLTETFGIPPFFIFATLTPIGAGYLLYQWRRYRKPKRARKLA